jgi:hypothetical protein
MKKIVMLFIFLLAAGGTAFYFGWVQLDIPAGNRAVIFTKTRGWDEKPAVPGAFAWRWENLIPGNLALYLYPDKTYTVELSCEGSLPSGDVYNLFLDGRPEFRYSLRFSLSYRVREDYFITLARDKGVLPEGLQEWLASAHTGIGAKGSAAATSLFDEARDPPLSPGSAEKQLRDAITGAIAADYPFLEVTDLAALQIVLPDTALYAKGRELYLEQANSKKEAIRQNANRTMDHILREDERMAKLKKYGEILTQYPILMDFLKIEKDL